MAVGASVLATAAAGPASAQQSGSDQPMSGQTMVPDYDGWFGSDATGGETESYSGTVDRRGEDSVTIEVGANGNGGSNAFAPTAVWVDPGTTITFEWVSNTHNVVVESQPDDGDWAGHEPIEDSGFSFEHTFDADGIYTYYCNPHLSLGMKGAIAVGDDLPMTNPETAASPSFTFPGGDVGVSYMGVLIGTAGLAAAIVLGGEAIRSVDRGGDGPRSAYVTALGAMVVGAVLLVAVVARLLVG